jgi:simple sugar transport system ATP-binding protein
MTEQQPVLDAVGISKRFGSVDALIDCDFRLNAGEVVALVGDNGAGKSTLVKVLAGVYQPDGGSIAFHGKRVVLTPASARAMGIETVYQDLALAPTLDAAENLFLGREIARQGLLGRAGFVDKKQMRRECLTLFGDLGVSIPNIRGPVSGMSGGQRQGVAVARATVWANQVVFLDEPTAALGVVQTKHVLDLIRRVRDRGLGVVLISHQMPDVLAVSDRIEVLRQGRNAASFTRQDATMELIIAAMTGALARTSEEP